MTTTPDAVVKNAVREAFDGIVETFPGFTINSFPDGQGGLWVELADLALSGPYVQQQTFVVFLLPFNLPTADVYPVFLRPDLARQDGVGLGEGFSSTQLVWPAEPAPRPVVQVSRRTRGGKFTSQTAAQKLAKVIDWVVTR